MRQLLAFFTGKNICVLQGVLGTLLNPIPSFLPPETRQEVMIVLAVILALATAYNLNDPILDDGFIRQINSESLPWVAERSARFEGLTYADVIRMQGVRDHVEVPERR